MISAYATKTLVDDALLPSHRYGRHRPRHNGVYARSLPQRFGRSRMPAVPRTAPAWFARRDGRCSRQSVHTSTRS